MTVSFASDASLSVFSAAPVSGAPGRTARYANAIGDTVLRMVMVGSLCQVPPPVGQAPGKARKGPLKARAARKDEERPRQGSFVIVAGCGGETSRIPRRPKFRGAAFASFASGGGPSVSRPFETFPRDSTRSNARAGP